MEASSCFVQFWCPIICFLLCFTSMKHVMRPTFRASIVTYPGNRRYNRRLERQPHTIQLTIPLLSMVLSRNPEKKSGERKIRKIFNRNLFIIEDTTSGKSEDVRDNLIRSLFLWSHHPWIDMPNRWLPPWSCHSVGRHSRQWREEVYLCCCSRKSVSDKRWPS